MSATTRMVAIAIAVAATAHADTKADTKAKGKTAKKAEVVTIDPKSIEWTAAPPDLPQGIQMAVLHGDPTKSGQFTVRFKMEDGTKVPPHWHSRDEQVTVIDGTFVVHMGDTMDAPAHELEEGAFHFLPPKMHHGAEAKGETIVQISGEGPFDIHYVNAADNPNPKSAKK